MFQRREFLKAMGAGLLVSVLPNLSYALAPAGYQRLLVLIELKGGNDGLSNLQPLQWQNNRAKSDNGPGQWTCAAVAKK